MARAHRPAGNGSHRPGRRGTLTQLVPLLQPRTDTKHPDRHRKEYQSWHSAQLRLTEPDHDRKLLGRVRKHLDNPDELIRPELVAAAVNDAAADNAIFTTDTGMATVWLSRLVEMRGERRLLGSFNLGSMANAMAQALGAQALDRSAR